MQCFLSLIAVLATVISTTSAHLFLKYPGTRGDNLWYDHGNKTACNRGTIDDYSGDRGCFPYGMQWMYPCGGLPTPDESNRTYWPATGGAVSFQPGWATGHSTAFIYVNLGLGTYPLNMSHPMVPVFQIVGPTNEEYPTKEVCIPQVGMPANLTFHEGQHATIQVVEAAKHGAALFSCADVILTYDMSKVTKVTPDNCKNSSDMGFNLVFATIPITNGALSSLTSPGTFGIASLVLSVIVASSWL